MRESIVAGVLLVLGCGAPSTPAPTQPARPPRAVESAGPADVEPCPTITRDDPGAARYLAFLEAELSRAGEPIGADLCIARVDGPRAFTRGVDAYMAADLLIHDRVSGVQSPLRVHSRDGGRFGHFQDAFLARNAAAELALRQLPEWLRGQPSLSVLSRQPTVDGTGAWLSWRGDAERALVCLEERGHPHRCWLERGEVRGLVMGEWGFQSEDPEEGPTGLLSVQRANARTVHWGVRTVPQLERAFAPRHTLPPPTLRPAWAQTRTFAEPAQEMPRGQWRPIPLVEPPTPGPLGALRVDPVVVDAELTVVVARSSAHARLCARTSGWVCGPLSSSGQAFLEGRVSRAFAIGPSRLAAVRIRRQTGSEPDAADRGDAWLEIHEIDGDRLALLGAIPIGDASWTTGASPDGTPERRLESVFHHVRREADDCVRIDAAQTYVGRTTLEFSRLEPGSPLNLARAGEVMPMLDGPAPSTPPRRDRGGLWRVEADRLRRVDRCGRGRTRLVAPVVPASLPDPAAACLTRLAERVAHRAPVAAIESDGPPCGAVIHNGGNEVARERYRYEAGRLVETLRLSHPTGDPADELVERLRPRFRGGVEVGREQSSMHLLNGEEQCGSESVVRYTVDARGRPTRAVSRVDSCEGVDPGPHVSRTRWSSGAGFERAVPVGRGAEERRFELPSHSDRQAEVGCSVVCECEVEARDGAGRPRVRLFSDDPSRELQFAYECTGAAWLAVDAAASSL